MIKKNYKKINKGFTLIELMVSISVFSMVMVISMGSILSVLDDNRKSQAIRAVMDNLNYTLEGMTRTIRFGSDYHCGSVGNITMPVDCSSGDNTLTVQDSNNETITYGLVGSKIVKTVSGGINNGTYDLTSPDVTITKLFFYVIGSYPFPTIGNTCSTIGYDCFQPKVIVIINGYAGAQATDKSSFSLETTLSQRKLDLQ